MSTAARQVDSRSVIAASTIFGHVTLFWSDSMSDDDALSAQELDIAEKVNKRVIRWLTLRYMWLVILIAFLSPIAGFLVGFVVETRLAKDEVDRQVKASIDEAKVSIDKELTKISTAVDKADNLSSDMKSYRTAFELVLSGTKFGDLTKYELKEQDTAKAVAAMEKRLEEFKVQFTGAFPRGIDVIAHDAKRLKEMQSTVDSLKSVFDAPNANDAKALSGAFFKIYELEIPKLEFAIMGHSGLSGSLIDELCKNTAAIKADVEMRGPIETGDQALVWEGVPVTLSFINESENAKQIGFLGQRQPYKLMFSLGPLANQEKWWRVGADQKKLDLRAIDRFDRLRIKLRNAPVTPVPAVPDRAWEILQLSVYSPTDQGMPATASAKRDKVVIPITMSVELFVNRTHCELVMTNLANKSNDIKATYDTGATLKTDAVPFEGYEFRFEELYKGLRDKYVKALSE